MLVRSQPWPLGAIYLYNGTPVEIVQAPRTTDRPRVVFVRDMITRMCFVAETHKLVRQARTQ